MKRAAIYMRVSSSEQNPATQETDLHLLAQQRGFTVVEEYVDHGISRRGHFAVVMVWAFDRLARSVPHLLRVLEELEQLGIEFVSVRENLDTHGPLGRALTIIIGAIAELERSLILERVKAGIRRARAEGRRFGRPPRVLDREGILRDRGRGLSLAKLASAYGASRSTIFRVLAAVPKVPANSPTPSN